MSIRKRIERFGRRWLVAFLGALFRARRRPVVLPDAPRILVVRLDERVGNMLLLLPLLESLKLRYPQGRVDLLAHAKNQALIGSHPTLSAFIPFRKRALFTADGPLAIWWRLRRRHYDAALDAANPTDPSTTQAILVRLAGAAHTIGVDHPGFGRMFSAPVTLPDPAAHEIDLRLALLGPLPGQATTRRMQLAALPALAAASPVVHGLAPPNDRHRVVLNLGARLVEKRLSVATYAELARVIVAANAEPLLTYGPAERALADAVAALCPEARVAPPTSLVELAYLMRASRGVVSCDTGPMHLAVAVGTPTCALFVSTPPSRYGHFSPPHLVVDARHAEPAAWLPQIASWLQRVASFVRP